MGRLKKVWSRYDSDGNQTLSVRQLSSGLFVGCFGKGLGFPQWQCTLLAVESVEL